MRTTIRLDDAMLYRAKAAAAASGRSLNEFIVDAIRVALTLQPARTSITLPTFAGSGLAAGVDLDDSASLRDLLDAGPQLPYYRPQRVAEGGAPPGEDRQE